jgi:hypothetical protein
MKDGPETMGSVAREVRAAVARAAPDATTVRAWGHSWLAGTDLILTVGAFREHVGIEFWRGASLKDPGHLLEGTGINLRHVKIRTGPEARAGALRRLVQEAVRLDARSEKRPRSGTRRAAARP